MFKLIWLTDIHLDKVRFPEAAKWFGEYLKNEVHPDAVVITGDISEAPLLENHLEQLEAGLGVPLYFILGNHDYYDGSFESTRMSANTFDGWLEKGPVELTPDVALVGAEGWYDARIGKAYVRDFAMSDWTRIDDFKPVTRGIGTFMKDGVPNEAKKLIIEIARERSRASAAEGRVFLEAALKTHSSVIFATHFPPFKGACWHEGQVSGSEWLPWFTSIHMGEMLLEVAKAHPDRKILVLCGHSHSSGTYQPLPNLLILTGEAVYRRPDIAGMISIDLGFFVEMRLNRAPYSFTPFTP